MVATETHNELWLSKLSNGISCQQLRQNQYTRLLRICCNSRWEQQGQFFTWTATYQTGRANRQ